MKRYTINEMSGKHQGKMSIILAENAIEAMKKAGMKYWAKSWHDLQYFGMCYEVYETGKPWHVEYVCHK